MHGQQQDTGEEQQREADGKEDLDRHKEWDLDEVPQRVVLVRENPPASDVVLLHIQVPGVGEAAEARLPQAELQELRAVHARVRGEPVRRRECDEDEHETEGREQVARLAAQRQLGPPHADR